jgi:hypothetical protein
MKQTLVTPLGLFVLLLSATVSEGKDCQNLDAHMRNVSMTLKHLLS